MKETMTSNQKPVRRRLTFPQGLIIVNIAVFTVAVINGRTVPAVFSALAILLLAISLKIND